MYNRFLKSALIIFSIIILQTQNSVSQNSRHYDLFLTNDQSAYLQNAEVKNALSDAVIIRLNKDELKSLYETRYPEISMNIPLPGNRNERLTLKRFDILKSDAKFVTRTALGNEEVKMKDLAVSYNGTINGDANSIVSITISRDNVMGMIALKNDNIVIGALNDNSGNPTDDYIIYKESDLKVKNTFKCETEENLSREEVEKMRKVILAGMSESSATDLYIVEVAIELDFATYNFFGGSQTNAFNYAIGNLAAVSAIYNKEVNVKLIIPYMRVWTTVDPYNGTTSGTLLNQFRSEWNANMQSVNRTVAHFMSKRSNNLGGVAWLNGLCSSVSSGYGYAFSNTIGGIAQLPNYSYEILVVAHELGHNFGSLHTFNCSWNGGPIDTCYTVEGGCYNGPLIPAVGTIMSYCFNNGSVSFVLGFGPQPRVVVRNGAEFAGCTYVSSRDVQVGFPNGGELFRTGNTYPIYWGTSLTGNVNIELSLNNGSTWQTIQNNVPATSRTYNWTVPEMQTSQQAKVRILDSSNPNNGDTSDAAFNIVLNLNAFNLLSPPTGTRLEVNYLNTETQRFVWQKSSSVSTVTYKFKIRKVGTTLDYTFNADNSGHDSGATIRKSLLDSLAATLGTTGDSVRCIWRAWSFNGYDSIQSATTFLITLVRTSVGINVISSVVPERFELFNNYPNPFNPSTNIKFDIAQNAFTELKIYDLNGKEVETLVNENLSPGSYEYNFNAVNLPSGVYFYKLKSGNYVNTKLMVLIK
ncbi:MAG: hypothetical protein HGGPFJEG_03035 [Ignavibacteria bacterium]|nr:hypothetical protein [Ignavibacteria bacterium]